MLLGIALKGGDMVVSIKIDTSAVSARQLSTQLPLYIYLFYENSNGNLTVLRTSNPEDAYDLTRRYWIDITKNMIDQLGHNSYLGVTKRSFKFAAPTSFSSLGGIYQKRCTSSLSGSGI